MQVQALAPAQQAALPLEDAIKRDISEWLEKSHQLMMAEYAAADRGALNEMARRLSNERASLVHVLHASSSGYEDQIEAQRALKFHVPILRLVRIMADHKAKGCDSQAMLSLLAKVTARLFHAKCRFEGGAWSVEPMRNSGWDVDMRKLALTMVRNHPQWFAPLPARLADERDYRTLRSILMDARASTLFAQKRRLRERIEAEMALDAAERALLARSL